MKRCFVSKEEPRSSSKPMYLQRGVFSNYLEFLEILVGLQSYFHYRGWPCKAACVTKPYGYLQLPPAQLHQFKAAGISSPAAGVIFWQSHEPSSSQQFYTWCLYKHGLFCLPCVHGQGHNCKTDYFHIQPEQEKKLRQPRI